MPKVALTHPNKYNDFLRWFSLSAQPFEAPRYQNIQITNIPVTGQRVMYYKYAWRKTNEMWLLKV